MRSATVLPPNDEPQRISHHLLLCATPTKAKCCAPQDGAATWDALKRLVREHGLEDPQRAGGVVLRSKVDCLRVCVKGPVLLVWPDQKNGSFHADAETVNLGAEHHTPGALRVFQAMLTDEPLQGVPGGGTVLRSAAFGFGGCRA